jgi:hypothetical protein
VVDRLLEITNDSTGLDTNNDGRVDAADIGAPGQSCARNRGS